MKFSLSGKTIQGKIVQQKGCALRKMERSPMLRTCEIQGAQHQISTKNYYFLCHVGTWKRQERVLSTITLMNTIILQTNIKSTGTLSTEYYQRLTLESWITNLKQMPLNCSQQLPYKRPKCTIDIYSLHGQEYHGLTDRWAIKLRI